MRPSVLPPSCAVLSMVTAVALAQATNYTSVEATAGKPVQLTYHASANKNCTAAPLPTIRVTQAPKAGVLTVRPAVLMTAKVAGCPKIKVPAQVVLYQAGGYAGPCRLRGDGFQRRAAAAAFFEPMARRALTGESGLPGVLLAE